MAFESTPDTERHQGPSETTGSIWIVLLALAVLGGLGFLVVYSRFMVSAEQMGDDHPGVGSPLSAFDVVPFIDADRTITQARLKGHVTLINYWGPWCPPCRIEMPHMVEIEKNYRDRDRFQFLSVACGLWVYDTLDVMRTETAKYRDEANLEFPIYVDPNYTSRAGLEAAIGKESQTMAYPTTVLIDRQGSIAGVWEGFSSEVPKEITASIDRLISEP